MKNKLYSIAFLIIAISTFLIAENAPAVDSEIQEEKVIIEESASNARPKTSNSYPRAENFYAYYPAGRGVSLNAFAGKIVILTFWTTYDRYSIKSSQPLQELYKKYQKKGLSIVSIAVDEPESVLAFVGQNPKLTYPILVGSKELIKQYDVWGLPTTYILDRDLCIRKVFSGYVNKKALEKEIRKLL